VGRDTPVFLEKGGDVFSSRSSCLEYLQKFHSKEKAVEIIIMSIKKKNGSILSF
jgi:hypothetical protein